jgi:hypothetical protein
MILATSTSFAVLEERGVAAQATDWEPLPGTGPEATIDGPAIEVVAACAIPAGAGAVAAQVGRPKLPPRLAAAMPPPARAATAGVAPV